MAAINSKNIRTGNLPLSGIRVIEMSSAIAGPAATRHLADFGAEVIKIESRTRYDIARLAPPYKAAKDRLNRSGYYSAYNAGKLSLSLNMNLAGAKDIFRQLISKSDVLVEAFRPGVMARWGFTYAQLQVINPKIIMASHSLQGQKGPMSEHRGFGHLSAATTGWFDITGPRMDEPPIGPYSAYTDFLSWPILFSSILLAFEERELSGKGTYIDHSHVDTSAYFATPELLQAQTSEEPVRRGNHEDHVCPNNVYPCAGDDRWCAITISSSDEWNRLCLALELPDHLWTECYNTVQNRKGSERLIDELIAEKTSKFDAEDLLQLLVDQNIAAGLVYRAEDLFNDPQLNHREAFRKLDHKDHGIHHVLAPAFKIEGINAGPSQSFPMLGEHNEYICKSILKMTTNEYYRYLDSGVLT